jgi:hypothetical protein
MKAITAPNYLPPGESSKNTPSKPPANHKTNDKNNQFENKNALKRDKNKGSNNVNDTNYERSSLHGYVDHNIALIFGQKDWLYMMINCILTYR